MKLFHRHRWELVSVQHGTYVFSGGDSTYILYRCECGETKIKTMNGHWTKTELAGRRKGEDG